MPDIQASLTQLLENRGLAPIVALERRPSPYASTYPLEELQVRLCDGSSLNLIFKDLSSNSRCSKSGHAKPDFLYDPLREINAYRHLLAGRKLGTADFYGAVVEPKAERYWLFLEHVQGEELYKIGDWNLWRQVARQLAGYHQQLAGLTGRPESLSAGWLMHDAEYFQLWMCRALEITGRRSMGSLEQRRKLIRLAASYETVAIRLCELPKSMIHGEFYPSNILVAHTPTGARICPIDWEMAAIGPRLIDLAAFVSGGWTPSQRVALASEYFQSATESGCPVPDDEVTFLAALDDCRLHLAIQWLGWSEQWNPPAEHVHDWLGEALALGEKIGCL
jgi:thiamine kinase-like enzyme